VNNLKIGVVGTCGSGKSELVAGLEKHGYTAKHIAQEHSFAPKMWQQLTNPDILVYLSVSFPVTLKRKSFNWSEKEYEEQISRMQHAITHADIKIQTDDLAPGEVLAQVLKVLEE